MIRKYYNRSRKASRASATNALLPPRPPPSHAASESGSAAGSQASANVMEMLDEAWYHENAVASHPDTPTSTASGSAFEGSFVRRSSGEESALPASAFESPMGSPSSSASFYSTQAYPLAASHPFEPDARQAAAAAMARSVLRRASGDEPLAPLSRLWGGSSGGASPTRAAVPESPARGEPLRLGAVHAAPPPAHTGLLRGVFVRAAAKRALKEEFAKDSVPGKIRVPLGAESKALPGKGPGAISAAKGPASLLAAVQLCLALALACVLPLCAAVSPSLARSLERFVQSLARCVAQAAAVGGGLAGVAQGVVGSVRRRGGDRAKALAAAGKAR